MRCCVVGMVLLFACSDAVDAPPASTSIVAAPASSISARARPALPAAEPDVDSETDDEIVTVESDGDDDGNDSDNDSDDNGDDNDSGDNDSDHQVIIDIEDRCPSDPADRDDWEDGCPEDDTQPAATGPMAIAPTGSGDEFHIPWRWTERGYKATYTSGGSTVELTIRDRDHDTATDEVDPCPDEPEDYDGWEDGDGCPEPDTSSHPVIDVEVVF